ncbi:MAG: Rab family GTPase, partial [Promethearchaeota archaeon]
VKLQIWDISGQERYKILRSSFFEGTDGALVVFDVSRQQTFRELDEWLSELRRYTGEDVPFIVLGNKIDLIQEIGGEYDRDGAEILAKDEDTYFVETSAKTGKNVEEAFLNLTKKMIHIDQK